MNLTKEEKQILLNIITNSRFTPAEWENVIKKIVVKLQVEEKPVVLPQDHLPSTKKH